MSRYDGDMVIGAVMVSMVRSRIPTENGAQRAITIMGLGSTTPP